MEVVFELVMVVFVYVDVRVWCVVVGVLGYLKRL